ncbi:MAM and LDL-receptor class A domain-containing protein 1-like, partial [Anneissia japonica]|uniref:MAM and LDL-receptor class A domain-containing protein 1-like n=1 Tax=Anneissia japonica TaxID=1529436 RepID=UPI001425A5B4
IVIEGERRSYISISIDDVVISDEKCPGIYSLNPDVTCDFEDGLCGYQSDPSVDVDWIRQQADDGVSGDGPDGDHTFGFDYGYYLCVNPDTTPKLAGHRARIISPLHNSTTTEQDYCVLFWYYVSGSNAGKLKVFVQQNGKKKLMWNVKDDQGDSWHRSHFQVTNDDPFQLIFEAIRGRGTEGAFCIDDVQVLNGTCPILYTTPTPTEPLPTERIWQVVSLPEAGCTFENDCGYGPYDETGEAWMVVPAYRRHPRYDHTIGANGHYLRASRHDTGLRYRLRTPFLYSTHTNNCLMFYYQCSSYSSCYYTFLNIYTLQQSGGGSLIDPIWSAGQTTSARWLKVQIDLPTTDDNFTVVFEAVSSGNYEMKLVIDDITGYTQNTGYGLNWIRINGSTPSFDTGPENDHTFSTVDGHYIYVEASPPAFEREQAVINTPTVRHINGPMCITFWYSMHGEDVGSLTLRVISEHYNRFIWSRNGKAGEGWFLANVDLVDAAFYDELYQLQFTGSIGRGYRGDIAIDDIKLVPNICNPPPSPPPAVTRSFCSFKNHPSTCNYQNQTDVQPWNYLDVYRSTEEGSVAVKISKGENSFLYADALSGRNVVIVSPKLKPSKMACLQFSYIIKEDFGLTIYLDYTSRRVTSLWIQMAPLWTRYSKEIKLDTENEFSANFTFELTHDTMSLSVIVLSGPASFCSTDTVNFVPYTEPTVIDKLDCDFERDCGFSTNTSLANVWQLSNKQTYSRPSSNLPNIDNTYGTPSGHYYYISFRADQPLTDRNFLRTPSIQKTSNKRCLQFYYYLNSNAASHLNVYIDDESRPPKWFPKDPIFTAIGKHGNRWTLVNVDIEQTKGNYSIVYEPRSGGGKYADIAIDDVLLFKQKCVKLAEKKWTSTIDCDFETESICGYKNIRRRSSNFDWTRNGGSTKTLNTGPSHDHTYALSDVKEGNYMYIETSPPRLPLDAAVLSSPLLPSSTESTCLHFWYHMNGGTVGRLEVYRMIPAIQEYKLLWSKEGEQGDNWRKAIVPLNVKRYLWDGSKEILDHSMKVHFRGVVGYGYEGDIAIDDVKVVVMSCDPPPESPPVNETDCDFENGIHKCGFEDNAGDDGSGGGGDEATPLDWNFFNASSIADSQDTMSNDTKSILAQNQSSYIFAEAANLKTGQRIVVTSPDIAAQSDHCLHFSYVNTGDFIIDIYSRSSSTSIETIYQLPREHQATWRKKAINMSPHADTFKVIFEGVVGREKTGFMALDDIKVEKGKCPTEVPETVVMKTQKQPGVTSSLNVVVVTFLSIFLAIFALALFVVLAFVYFWKGKKRSVDLIDECNKDDEMKKTETVELA